MASIRSLLGLNYLAIKTVSIRIMMIMKYLNKEVSYLAFNFRRDRFIPVRSNIRLSLLISSLSRLHRTLVRWFSNIFIVGFWILRFSLIDLLGCSCWFLNFSSIGCLCEECVIDSVHDILTYLLWLGWIPHLQIRNILWCSFLFSL